MRPPTSVCAVTAPLDVIILWPRQLATQPSMVCRARRSEHVSTHARTFEQRASGAALAHFVASVDARGQEQRRRVAGGGGGGAHDEVITAADLGQQLLLGLPVCSPFLSLDQLS